MALPTITMNRTAIVTVPLFTAPYSVPVGMSANGFRRYSLYPQLSAGVANNLNPSSGFISQFWGAIPGPATAFPFANLGAAGNAGGPIFFGTSMDGFASVTSGNILYSFPFNPNGGNQNPETQQARLGSPNLNTSSQSVGTYIAYDTNAGIDHIMPFWGLGGPANGQEIGIAYVIPNLGSPITGAVLNRASGLVSQIDMFDPGIIWNSWITAVTYMQCPAQNGLIYGFWDTANVASAIPRQILGYFPAPFTGTPPLPSPNYTPRFDDPVLQAAWTTAPSYTLDIYKGGWIIKLGTAGAGPTAQPEEIAITDPGMTQYMLLRFAPQDNGAQLQMNHATTFGWQVKIDPNGVLYFNSGAPGDAASVLYSYSPIQFLYPQFAYKPGFITLPCYTPCDAVTVEG